MRSRAVVTLLIIGAASAPATQAGAASLPAGTTALLSGNAALDLAFPAPVSYASSSSWSASQDGRYVAFHSESDGLVAGDDDRAANVFVKDRATGALTFVSRATGATGEPAHDDCYAAAISDDGTRVAFQCQGPLDPADTNGALDVYVRDLPTATTHLVSRASGLGAVSNRRSVNATLSATGEYVAFESDATNLVAGVSSGAEHVYRRRIGSGDPLVLVSRTDGASGTPKLGAEPSISDDGTKVAFSSRDTGVDPADTNAVADVYVRDLAAGTTVLASRQPGTGPAGNGRSDEPALAGDGSAVAFTSQSNQFDFGSDPDTEDNIYWRSLEGPTGSQNTALVDVNAGGDKASRSYAPAIDDSGDVVAFASQAVQLDPADPSAIADVYVKNVSTNALHVASRHDGTSGAVANVGAYRPGVSGDGTRVAFAVERAITPDADPYRSSVVVRELTTTPQRTTLVSRPPGTAAFVNAGGESGAPELSADGRLAVFDTTVRALLPAGVARGIVVRDRVTGTLTLVSRQDGPAGAPFTGAVFDPSISADGRRVSFTATPTLDGDASKNEVWVRDLEAGRTFLASRADGPAGAAAGDDSYGSVLDADGSRVAFGSQATNLVGGADPSTELSVYVRDLATGRTLLASRANGLAGANANDWAGDISMSADGNRVAFVTAATNLGDGDADDKDDVHLRDLAAGTTALISITPGGVKNAGSISATSMDDEGRRVAFAASGTSLMAGASNGRNVFVRDLVANTLVLASRADGPAGAASDGGSYSGVISGDGRYVAFESDGGNLVPGAGKDVVRIYRRDLVAGRTELASRAATGAPSALDAYEPTITRDGACVGFTTADALVGAATDFHQSYLRAFAANCGDPVPPGGGGAGGDGAGGGAAGGGAGAGGPAAVRDTVAPVVSAARLSRRRFRVGRAATPTAAAIGRGTVLSFRVSEASTATLTLERVRPGRRARPGRRSTCRPVRRRPRRGACTAYTAAGTLTRRLRAAGPARVALSGRVGRRALPAGRYRLTVVARDAAGNRSRPVALTFTIVRR